MKSTINFRPITGNCIQRSWTNVYHARSFRADL